VTTRCTAVPADAAQLTVLMRSLQEFAIAVALDASQARSFELALEEIFMNIVMHGSRPGIAPRVEVSLHRDAESVTMIVEDDGPQFDPRQLRAHCGAQPAAHEQALRWLSVIRSLARGRLTLSTPPPRAVGRKIA